MAKTQDIRVKLSETIATGTDAENFALNVLTSGAHGPILREIMGVRTMVKDSQGNYTKSIGGVIGAIIAVGTGTDEQGNACYQTLANLEDVIELSSRIDIYDDFVSLVRDTNTGDLIHLEVLSPLFIAKEGRMDKLLIGYTEDNGSGALLQVGGSISATENIFTNLRVPKVAPTNPTSDEYYFYVGEIGTGATTPEVSGSGTLVQLTEHIQANNIQDYGVLNIQNYTEDVPSGEYSVSLSGHRHTVADIHDIADNYLKLSGGTITGTTPYPLTIKSSSTTTSAIRLTTNSGNYAHLSYKYLPDNNYSEFIVTDNNGWNNEFYLIHTGNAEARLGNKFLKLNGGGTITGPGVSLFSINRTDTSPVIRFLRADVLVGYLGVDYAERPFFVNTANETEFILHSGNVGDYAIKKPVSVSGVDMDTVKTTGFYQGYNVTNSAKPTISTFIVNKYSDDWGGQIQHDIEHNRLYVRTWRGSGGIMDETWKEIAFIDSNVASAQNLTHSNGTLGATVSSGGNVLIGTTEDSTAKLQVKGAIEVWNDTQYCGTVSFNRKSKIGGLYNTNYHGWQIQNVGGNLEFYIERTDTTRASIVRLMGSSGIICIGENPPPNDGTGAKLQVAGDISSNGNLVATSANIMEVMGYTPPSGDALGHRFMANIVTANLVESDEFYGVIAEFNETITAKENIFTNLRVPKVAPTSPTSDEYYFYVADIGSGASTPEEVYQYSITQIADTTSLGANIREAYQLVKANGEVVGDTIKIYKDSALQSVTAENGVIKFNYLTTSGDSSTIELPLKDLITETIAGNGISIDANTNILSVDIADGDANPYLGFNENGALYLKGGIMTAGDGLVEVTNESGVVTALRHAYLAGNSETTEDTTDVRVGQIITGVTRDRFGHIKSITTKNLSEVFKADTSLGDNDYAVTVTVGEDGSVKFKVTIDEIDGGTF